MGVGEGVTAGIGEVGLNLDATYLRLDTTNDPLTGNLDLGGNNLIGDGDTYLDFSTTADTIDFYVGAVNALRIKEDTYDQVIISPDGVQNLSATPSLAFGDGDSGLFEAADDSIYMALAGANAYYFESSYLRAASSAGFWLRQGTSSSTEPGHAFVGDTDTGVGRAAADQLSLIAGAQEGLRLTELSNGVVPQWHTTAGITASTTQTQGQQPLISHLNEISVCANANDTVTLPAAIGGDDIIIINNGASTLRIFPASGDDCGAGADTQITLAAGSNLHLVSYNNTNWEQI